MFKSTTPIPHKVDLLEYFYEHLSEDDWLEGVDIYQAGKVTEVTAFESLITAKVQRQDANLHEVRLKVHPSGRVIQWIECTCKKNRTYGAYCEHIAALMIHVDREQAAFIAKLDLKMPLNPPSLAKRMRQKPPADSNPEATGSRSTNKSKGASHSLLDHLKGSIHSIALIGQGPNLRVKIEIKPGVVTNYDLDIDGAAHFLLSAAPLSSYSSELKKLKVYSRPAELGTRLYLKDEEKIVAEKSVILPPSSSSLEAFASHLHAGSYVRLSLGSQPGQEAQFSFLPLKNAARYLGKEYFFLPGAGYWPIQTQALAYSWDELPLTKTYKDDDAARFVQSGFAEYLAAGPIWLDQHLKKPDILSLPELSSITIQGESDGWFRLDPRYGQGKASISMVSLMQQARQKKRKFVKTAEGWLKIPDFITQHDWQLDEKGQYIKADTLSLMRLQAALGDFDKFVGSKSSLQKLRRKFEIKLQEKLPSLQHTRLQLRNYQAEGLQWFWWLYTNGLHGLLADDMGLGKTHQAMALMSAIQSELGLQAAKKRPKFLIVCPTTVLDHWEDKVNEFAPNLKPLKYHGAQRYALLESLKEAHDTLITSYGVLLRDSKKLSEIPWHAVILDEAHYVKNNNTATYRAACKLSSQIRLCLTGTPMENHLNELKSLFDFLVPGYLGSDDYFRKTFIQPILNKDLETELTLQKLIHPLKLRRSKRQVLADLPAKVEDIRHCNLSPEQVRLYRDVLNMKAKPLLEKLTNDQTPVPYLHVFAILQLLKQVCDHPALLDAGADYRQHESDKFELLKELIREALDSGNKIVIFSQYVKMVEIIQHYCLSQQIACLALTGKTRNRGPLIAKFQSDPNTKIFASSLLTGGIGIDLTAASVVIHYDRWWNASKEAQATDRVHRIGQQKFVQVIKLVTRGTLEEKIDKMIAKKQNLFQTFLEKDEDLFKTMSRQELLELLL